MRTLEHMGKWIKLISHQGLALEKREVQVVIIQESSSAEELECEWCELAV